MNTEPRKSDPTNAQMAETLHGRTLEVLDVLIQKSYALSLLDPPQGLEIYRRRLQEGFTLVILGEARRGKSTLANALVGRPLLPTETDMPSNQIVEFRPAETEAFHLRFEDDSSQEIRREELTQYGFQRFGNGEGPPHLGQLIRSIEIETPMQYMPAGIHLIDTPGLGSLFHGHAEITHRVVTRADAVIFVVDSEKPIIQTELDFIDSVLDVTRNILFVQTKIDLFDARTWETILLRNEEILRKHYGGRLSDTRVWPISSRNLLQAAADREHEESYLRVSRQPEFVAALSNFLLRSGGWRWLAEAVIGTDQHTRLSRDELSERLRVLREATGQKAMSAREQFMTKRTALMTAWGEQGDHRRELLKRVEAIGIDAQKGFLQAIEEGGSIEKGLSQKIDAIETLAAAQNLAATLADEIAAQALKCWQETMFNLQAQCEKTLADFDVEVLKEFHFQSTPVDLNQPVPQLEIRLRKRLDRSYRQAFGGVYHTLGIIGGIGTAFTLNMAAVMPLAVTATFAAAAWGAVRGFMQPSIEALPKAHESLRQYIKMCLKQIREVSFGAGQVDTEPGFLENQFYGLLENVDARIGETISKRKAEFDRQIETFRLEDEMRQESIEKARRRIAEFDRLILEIEELGHQLTTIERQLPDISDSVLMPEN